MIANAVQAVLHSYVGRPFTWGATDCLYLASDVAAVVSGKRTALDAPRGAYSSRLDAALWLRVNDYGSLAEFASDALQRSGWQALPPAFAGVGDIGISKCGALCVRVGAGFVARNARGQFAIVEHVKRAWTCRK